MRRVREECIVEVEIFSRAKLLKFLSHRRVVARQFFDRQILSFVVRQAQVVFARKERLLGFFELFNGFVDTVDRVTKFATRQVVITRKTLLERFHTFFEVGDIDVLFAHECKFLLVFEAVKRSVAQ